MLKLQWKRSGGLAAGTAMLALAAAPGATAATPHGCGPANAPTLAGNSQVRIYRLASKGTATTVFGCIRGSSKTTPIGPVASAGPKAAVHPPIALNGKWVGVVEERPVGKTAKRVYVASRNVGSGKGRRCLIGSGDAKSKAPAVRVVLMNQAGALGWAAITPTPNGRAPLIGACDSQGNRVLASGAGVEIDTLQLTGSTLHWVDASGPRSAQLR